MRAASLHDLHLATGISKPTLTRILKTASQHGLVWQRMVDGAFLPSHTLQRRGESDDDPRLVGGAPPGVGGGSPRGGGAPPLAGARRGPHGAPGTNHPRAPFPGAP